MAALETAAARASSALTPARLYRRNLLRHLAIAVRCLGAISYLWPLLYGLCMPPRIIAHAAAMHCGGAENTSRRLSVPGTRPIAAAHRPSGDHRQIKTAAAAAAA